MWLNHWQKVAIKKNKGKKHFQVKNWTEKVNHGSKKLHTMRQKAHYQAKNPLLGKKPTTRQKARYQAKSQHSQAKGPKNVKMANTYVLHQTSFRFVMPYAI